jgi:hypothetical protein
MAGRVPRMNWMTAIGRWMARWRGGRASGKVRVFMQLDRPTERRIRRGIEARLGRRPLRGTG